mgnify:CR=1 FL=1
MSKRGKKEAGATEKTKSSAPAAKGYERTIHLLIENNISLQKKLVHLTESIDDLNKKTGRLLHLIEIASEEFTKDSGEELMPGKMRAGQDDLLNKLDGLIQQNRTIARGLLLLEKYVREKTGGGGREMQEREEVRPLPEFKF